VSAVAARGEAAPAPRTWLDRLLSAVPLASVFIWLCLVYAWEARGHASPWIFTDELELTQISRSIADTGQAARRGEPYFFQTLYAYVLAPAWLISSTETAYEVAKYIGIFAMTSVVFPVYFLARMIVAKPAALFAAAAAGAIPSLAYATMLLEEPFAYPYAALAFLLIAKALATRTRWWVAAAVVASLLAPLARSQLAVIPAVFVLAAIGLAWTSPRARRWRATWSRWDWVGAIVLAAGALVLFSAIMGERSEEWSIATGHFRGRMVEYGLWAAGALTIGLGVLPVVVGLAALARPRDEPRTPELRAFLAVATAGIVCFGFYTAVKASYLSTKFATRIEERNLIYISPLLLVATALWLDRPRLRLVPLACAIGLAAYLIVSTPFALDSVPYSDAFGLSIVQMSNRVFAFTDDIAQWVLLAVLAGSTALLLAPRWLGRQPRAVPAVLGATAVLVVAWCLTGQIAGAVYSNDTAKLYLRNFPNPPTWLDEATGGRPAVYLGQQVDSGAALGVWLTEFWNPSLKHIWSTDGTAPGPGPILTPDLAEADGRLFPDPQVPYVVTEPGLDIAGTRVATRGRWTVYRVAPPLRLAHSQEGIFSDGQTGCDLFVASCPTARSAYNQYATSGGRRGWMSVNVSRFGACGAPIPPGEVVITIGTLVKGPDKQPTLGRVLGRTTWVVEAGAERRIVLATPKPPFRVEVRISPTYSPSDYGESDRRRLGAQVGYTFSLTPLRETQRTCS
jgi:hypothetical protein